MSRFVIDQRRDAHHGRDVWCVWELAVNDEPTLLGEFDSVSSAKASLDVPWRAPHYLEMVSWAYIAEPEAEENDDHPHAVERRA
jgi:hypothetical protein